MATTEIKCPRCGSTQLTANKKGFGLGNAVVGGALVGGLGLLGGFFGSRKVKITCLACGKEFKPGECRNEDDTLALTLTEIKNSLNENYSPEAINNNCDLEIDPLGADAYYFKGGNKDELGDYAGAIVYYTKAIEINPRHTSAYFCRGIAKSQINDYNGAIDDFNKLIEIKPDKSEAYFFRGEAKENIKDYIGAIADFTKLKELDPKNILADSSIKLASIYLERYEKISDCTKVIENDPNSANAYLNRGDAKFLVQDNIGAIIDYTRAIEIEPDNVKSYEGRGTSKLILEDYRGAIADYTKIIEIDPKYVAAYETRGYIKFKKEDYNGAVADYTKVIEINPENKQAYYDRGIAEIKLHQIDIGYLDLSKAGELGHPEAYKAIVEYCQ